MKTRSCSSCGEIKDVSQFGTDKRGFLGTQAKCRTCANKWIKDHNDQNPAWGMLRRAKARAIKKGLEFDITVADITPLPETCPVFGVPLCVSKERRHRWTYTLDRVDNSRGYVRGNVVVISYHANRLKNDGSALEHEKIAAWMREVIQ